MVVNWPGSKVRIWFDKIHSSCRLSQSLDSQVQQLLKAVLSCVWRRILFKFLTPDEAVKKLSKTYDFLYLYFLSKAGSASEQCLQMNHENWFWG